MENYADKFKNYTNEVIYTQTSKDIYETGEDLWFKCYLLDSQSFSLSDTSKTLYMQMVDSKDSIVWQEKYPFEYGLVSGHIYLDNKLPRGDYFLETYSRHSFYEGDTIKAMNSRKITVLENISEHLIAEKKIDNNIRFNMFPEGGDLVYGIQSKLAFKSTDGKGRPVSVEGILYGNNQPLMPIKSTYDGMGYIMFTPLNNVIYHIELDNGVQYKLPHILSKGMVQYLSSNENDTLKFKVLQTNDMPVQQVYLIGQMRGMVCCIAKGIIKDSLNINIPTSNFLYQGIAEFTLCNSSLQPISERLVYINQEKKLNITAETEKDYYDIRERGIVKIKVTDEDGKPVRANLGISIYDEAYNYVADPMNILAYCYLSSQIKGGIYKPAHYFDELNHNRKKGLDLLLLTQGWRRYIWNSYNTPYKGTPFISDEIKGVQTINKKKKKKSPGEQIIQVSDADGNFQFLWGDSTGNFVVNTEIMKSSTGYLYLKPMLSKEFKPELKFVDCFNEINKKRSKNTYNLAIINLDLNSGDNLHQEPVISNDSVIMLDEVTITRKIRKPFRDKFMGRLDSLAKISLNDVYVCGCGYLQNFKPDYDAHPAWKPCHVSPEKRTKPVEGKKYEIVKFKQLEGNTFSVVDRQTVTYNAPVYTDEELLRINNLWRIKGYYRTREFYQPDEVDIKLSIPDARNTLFWNPNVLTDENGEATISFYCSDINTKFVGIVEGVDGLGLLGTTKLNFRVMRK